MNRREIIAAILGGAAIAAVGEMLPSREMITVWMPSAMGKTEDLLHLYFSGIDVTAHGMTEYIGPRDMVLPPDLAREIRRLAAQGGGTHYFRVSPVTPEAVERLFRANPREWAMPDGWEN